MSQENKIVKANGLDATFSKRTGDNHSAIASIAGSSSGRSGNMCYGLNVGVGIVEGYHNVLVGNNIDSTHNNCVVIGSNIRTTRDNQIIIGNEEIMVSGEITSEQVSDIQNTIKSALSK